MEPDATTCDAVVEALETASFLRRTGVLHQQHALSDRFIAHKLARNLRIEEDLVDQLGLPLLWCKCGGEHTLVG